MDSDRGFGLGQAESRSIDGSNTNLYLVLEEVSALLYKDVMESGGDSSDSQIPHPCGDGAFSSCSTTPLSPLFPICPLSPPKLRNCRRTWKREKYALLLTVLVNGILSVLGGSTVLDGLLVSISRAQISSCEYLVLWPSGVRLRRVLCPKRSKWWKSCYTTPISCALVARLA